MLSSLQHAFLYLRRYTLRERLQWRRQKLVRHIRLAWWRTQTGKRQVEVKIQEGVRILLYPDSHISQFIYCEDYEIPEREFLKLFLKPGDIFVDIGANIGLFTILAGRYVGAEGAVYAFEPCAKTYQRLLANVELNELTNVSCHQTALSDHTGSEDLVVSLDGFDDCNSLARPVFGKQFGSERVGSTTWDEFADEHGLTGRVAMMKIDVEGWETYVVDGAARTLGREDAPILQVEFCDQAAQSAGSSSQQLYRALEALGYQMYIYDVKTRKLIHDALRDRYPLLNLIAVKHQNQIIPRLSWMSMVEGSEI